MKPVPLSRLRDEAVGYNSFIAGFQNPLSPFSMSLQFDQIFVNLSASPYICLINKYSKICISHIKTVKRRERENTGITYILTCLDYTLSDDPAEHTIEIKFSGKSS